MRASERDAQERTGQPGPPVSRPVQPARLPGGYTPQAKIASPPTIQLGANQPLESSIGKPWPHDGFRQTPAETATAPICAHSR
eukprot:6482777-Prymnesium_polylepis.1